MVELSEWWPELWADQQPANNVFTRRDMIPPCRSVSLAQTNTVVIVSTSVSVCGRIFVSSMESHMYTKLYRCRDWNEGPVWRWARRREIAPPRHAPGPVVGPWTYFVSVITDAVTKPRKRSHPNSFNVIFRCYEHQKQDSIHILCVRLVVKNSNKQNKPKIFAQPNTLGAVLLSAGKDMGSAVQAWGHERRSSCSGHEQVLLLSMLFKTGMNRLLESNPDGWVWGSSQRLERLEIINVGTFWPFYLVRNPLTCKTETVVKTKIWCSLRPSAPWEPRTSSSHADARGIETWFMVPQSQISPSEAKSSWVITGSGSASGRIEIRGCTFVIIRGRPRGWRMIGGK